MEAVATMPKPKHARKLKRQTTEGQWIVSANGRKVRFLNYAIPLTRTTPTLPVAPLYTAACEVCGHGYSELMVKASIGVKTCICDECRSDYIALNALSFQLECGVNLGWKPINHDDHEIRAWGRWELPSGMRVIHAND